MAGLLCASCTRPLRVDMGNSISKVSGTAICEKCQAATGFVLQQDTVTWVSGLSSYGALSSAVPEAAKAFYGEAERCFLAAAPNGAAAMCRSSIEQGLEEAGFPDGILRNCIDKAKNAGRLGDEEVSLAHGSRLIGNEAVHAGTVDLAIVPAMLTTAIRILNRLFP